MISWVQRLVTCLAVSLVLQPSWAIKLRFVYEECLFETLTQDDLVTGSFVSLEAEGYKPLVRLRVTNSNGEEVYSVGAKAEDKFSIRARTPGQYSFCLTLAPSSATRLGKRGYRDVLWHLQKGHLFTHHQVTENHLNPLLEIVSGLKGDLMECRSLQLYLKDRELRHRHTVDSTHSRVKGYAALQMLTVIVASVLQVAFIRKLFSTEGVRRVHSKTDI